MVFATAAAAALSSDCGVSVFFADVDVFIVPSSCAQATAAAAATSAAAARDKRQLMRKSEKESERKSPNC